MGKTRKRSSGGAAAIGGFNFQHALSAWAACGVLGESAISARWGLPAEVYFSSIKCESQQSVDDLVIGTSASGHVYLQITKDVSRSESDESKLASCLKQCVKQFHFGSIQNRSLDVNLDRLVIATDGDAPIWFRAEAPKLLERFRLDESIDTLSATAKSKDDAKTAKVVEKHVEALWQEIFGCKPNATQRRKFFSLLRFDHFELGIEDRDRLAATDLLRRQVLTTPSQSQLAFTLLVQYCSELARLQIGASRATLKDFLENQTESILLKGPLSFEKDIDRLRNVSKQSLKQLAGLSFIQLRANDDEIKIAREAVSALVEGTKADIGHCLVVGEPGAGKSGVLHDSAAQLLHEGRDVIYFAADRISATNAQELQSEWKLDHLLADSLHEFPGNDLAYLIIDGLDTARSDVAAKFLRELITYTIQMNGRWRVVASIRKFDLRYSLELQDIFRGVPVLSPTPDLEFEAIRHLNVHTLSDDELEQASSQSQVCSQLISLASELSDGALLKLLRNPFNLRLALFMLSAGSDFTEFSAIHSQIELLEGYWNQRVVNADDGAHAREQVCRLLCQVMAKEGSLHCHSSVVPSTDSAALRMLKKAGVLVEWQPPGQNAPIRDFLAYSHNVLFDYACARLLMRQSTDVVLNLIKSQKNVLLTLQPSFVLHFHYLWLQDENRSAFWQTVFDFQIPEVPGIGQLIGLAVCSENAKTDSDLSVLVDALSSPDMHRKNAAEKSVQYLAGALLSSYESADLVGREGGPWCDWLNKISRSLTMNTVSSVRVLTYVLSESSSEIIQEQLKSINVVACNLFDFSFDNQTTFRSLLPTAVPAICRSYQADPQASSPRLRRLIDKETIEAGQIDGLNYLAYELDHLFGTASDIVSDMYESVFSAADPKDRKVAMGDSKLLALTSTLLQDFRGIKYQLGEKFELFLKADPLSATTVFCRTLESYIRNRRSYREEHKVSEFDFGALKAKYVADYSVSWDEGDLYRHDPPVKMLNSLVRHLETLASKDKDLSALEKIIECLVEQNRYAVVWRRLLSVGGKYPKALGMTLLPMVEADVVLLEADTSTEAIKFLESAFADYEKDVRGRIEAVTLQLPDSVHAYKMEYGERVRDVILSRLPKKELVTAEAKERQAELLKSNNSSRLYPGVVSQSSFRDSTEEDELRFKEEQGIPAREPQNFELRRLWKSISEGFNPPEDSELDKALLWQNIGDLKKGIDAADALGVHPQVKNDAIGYLAQFVTSLAAKDEQLADNTKVEFSRKCLLLASNNEVPVYDEERNQQFERSQSWGNPSARIDAANGLMVLSRNREFSNESTISAIQRLSQDSTSVVRYMIVDQLLCIFDSENALFRNIAEQVSENEASDPILSSFIHHVLRPLPDEQLDYAIELGERIFNRSPTNDDDRNARSNCMLMFLHGYVGSAHPRCAQILHAAVDNPSANLDALARVAGSLRDSLGYGIHSALTEQERTINARAWNVTNRLASSAIAAWKTVVAQAAKLPRQEDDSPDDADIRERWHALFHLLDYMSTDIYFASGVYDEEKSTSSCETLVSLPEGKLHFLDQVEPIVCMLGDLGLVPISHHLIQFLAGYVEVDPERIFVLIGKIIVASVDDGYQNEQLGADLIVRIFERYLAEYRHVLKGNSDCQDLLIRVLDIFVGWPSARKLVYQLGDIYR